MRLILALLLTACPALAEDGPGLDPKVPADPGAVALYLQAQQLYVLGQAGKDPLMVLTAARLLHGLTLTETPRLPDPAPERVTAVSAPDAAQVLNSARKLDAGLAYSDLIDMLAREVPPHPRVLRATASTLEPGATEVWTLPFFGGTYGELAILGDGNGNLDMVVTVVRATPRFVWTGAAAMWPCAVLS